MRVSSSSFQSSEPVPLWGFLLDLLLLPWGRGILSCYGQTMGRSVSDTSRVDPELTLDAVAVKATIGGPVMAETTDRWVVARGRRILCRVY